MKFKNTICVCLAVCLMSFTAISARADDLDKKTTITFSQPVEIPGHVLPAGTYIFKLMSSFTDRHIVQVFNADESKLIATILAIPDTRLTATDQTVIRFAEVPAGSPEAIRAWFYPGSTIGQEFVYPRARAAALAMASKTAVPAVTSDVVAAEELKNVRIVAVTPELRETSLAEAIQTAPSGLPAPDGRQARRTRGTLPNTASSLPLIVMLGVGFGSIFMALAVMASRKPAVVRIR